MWCSYVSSGAKRVVSTRTITHHVPIRTYAKLSPRVLALQRIGKERAPKSKNPHGSTEEERNWPLGLIEAAYKTGNLPIAPFAAIRVLEDFADLQQRSLLSQERAESFVQDHQITPRVLGTLAKILLRSSSVKLALPLLSAASALQDEDATCILVEEGLKHGRAQDLQHAKLQGPFGQLQKLAVAGNPAAVLLQARLLELKGNLKEALEGFKSAILQASANQNGEKTDHRTTLAEAWQGVARVEFKFGNSEKEVEALEVAALQYDNSEAIYKLALKRHDDDAPSEAAELFLKAAVSGIGNAAFMLGTILCSQMEAKEEDSSSPQSGIQIQGQKFIKEYNMIKEWFTIALESAQAHSDSTGRAQASLQIARVLRKTGQLEQSVACLDQAIAQMQPNTPPIHSLRELWGDPTFNPTSKDIKSLFWTDRFLDHTRYEK